jgi:CubicO group peptidase (beta-lactamase class C family)
MKAPIQTFIVSDVIVRGRFLLLPVKANIMKTVSKTILALHAAILCLSAVPAFSAGWVSRHSMTAAEYQTEFNKWTAPPYNYRLISVCGYDVSGQANYAAIWEDQPGAGWITHPQMTKAQFDTLSADYAEDDMYPVFISGFGVGGLPYYNAIWEYSPGADVVARVGLSHANYVSENSTRVSQGYKLVHLWTFNAGATEYFTAIWRKGVAPIYTPATQLTAAQYQAQFDNLGGQGYQLVAVSAAVIGGVPRYAGLWRKPGDGSSWYSQHDLSEVNYQGQSWNWYYQGYRPVLTSVHVTGAGRRFNMIVHRNGGMTPNNLQTIDTAIQQYMNDKGVPGLSLAISRNGELVYAKGFGQADQGANEWVHPQHRFRIASVSKTITAAAVLRLQDHCGLDLDDTVFGANGLLGNSFGTPPYSTREQQITVRHLLHHTTGWSSSQDGIWQVGGDDPDPAIDWQLDNTQPGSTPGTAYDYMNTDYVTAGRVIERRIGKSYRQFCKDELLGPSCITDMDIGGTTLAERKPGEVVYYGGSPYSLSPSRMDANGGWIAKPMDLLLFLRRIDGDTAQADLLQPDSITAMQTGSTPNMGYGLGLVLQNDWWGHNGCMPGTIAFLVYRNDGLAFAVTCNTRPADDSCAWTLRGVIDGVIDTLDAANAWPNYDLFPCSTPSGPAPKGLADPRNFYVDGPANCLFQNGVKTCSFLSGPFAKVVSAYNISCSGDVLNIRAGSYNETLTFNKLMTVRSYDGSAVIGK